MRIERHYTTAGQSPYRDIEFRQTKSEIRNPDGSIVFPQDDIEVPAAWSQVACDVLAQKYFRKAGVPARQKRVEENAFPPSCGAPSPTNAALAKLPAAERYGETSAKQVFDRLAGTWTYWGWKGGYFDTRGRRPRLLRRDALHAGPPDGARPIRRNGSTPACTGPMASTGRARAIFMSITTTGELTASEIGL